MIHIINKTTGRIIEQCLEGSDVSRFDPADHEVTAGAPSIDDRDRYRYQAGELALKPVVTLAADKTAVAADGLDQAMVSVNVTGADPLPAAIDIEAGGLVETVALESGAGQLPPITAETPGDIQVRADDPDNYFDQGGITISAEA